MKITLSTFICILWNCISFSQTNDYKLQRDAILVIKESSNYIKYIEDNNYKNQITVADGFYPICAFCKSFVDFIVCCKPTNDVANFFKNLGGKGLKELGDTKHSKVTLYFTITENNYFIGEIIGNKKKHKTLSYLFKFENEKLDLVKVIENK